VTQVEDRGYPVHEVADPQHSQRLTCLGSHSI
jgi:hypothetical protein